MLSNVDLPTRYAGAHSAEKQRSLAVHVCSSHCAEWYRQLIVQSNGTTSNGSRLAAARPGQVTQAIPDRRKLGCQALKPTKSKRIAYKITYKTARYHFVTTPRHFPLAATNDSS